jgi:hypothetical protein
VKEEEEASVKVNVKEEEEASVKVKVKEEEEEAAAIVANSDTPGKVVSLMQAEP